MGDFKKGLNIDFNDINFEDLMRKTLMKKL